MKRKARSDEKPTIIERAFNPLAALVDATLAIEKLRVVSEVRQSHFTRQGKTDIETDELHRRLVGLEEYVDGRVADLIKAHSAYSWFSRIKGVGKENIGKVVGLIDVEKADTISSLWKFSGRAPEDGRMPKREKGKKLSYNSQLRAMTWRLGVSLMRAQGKYYNYYLAEKIKYYERFEKEGIKIVPTPAGRFCPECLKEVTAKATKYCPDCGTLLTKKSEPGGVMFEGHIHNMALVKMIKLFLAHLWLVWREAEGLPVSKPYAIDIQKHSHFIGPWEMCDK